MRLAKCHWLVMVLVVVGLSGCAIFDAADGPEASGSGDAGVPDSWPFGGGGGVDACSRDWTWACQDMGRSCGTYAYTLCGVPTEVDCGSCEDGEVCQEGQCQCAGSSPGPQACEGVAACGALAVEDACGNPVEVDCGSCGPEQVCQEGQCAPAQCTNGERDMGEVDVDCGGTCGPCPLGQGCALDADCKEGLCEAGVCAPDLCLDVVCAPGEVCGEGRCQTLCQEDAQCPTPQFCLAGACEDLCAQAGCGAGQSCDRGRCLGACQGDGDCALQEACLGGTCRPISCEGVTCRADETCYAGQCRPACQSDAQCGTEACVDGACTLSLCEQRPVVAPLVRSAARCGKGALTLMAEPAEPGQAVRWYREAQGGEPVFEGTVYEVEAEEATTYWVAAFDARTGCESAARVAVEARVLTVPTPVQLEQGNLAQCGGQVTLRAQGGEGGTLYFQGQEPRGTSLAVATSERTVARSGTYYFRSRSPEGCWSEPARADVAIYQLPQPVYTSGAATQCGGAATLTASGGEGGTIYFQGTQSDGTSLEEATDLREVDQTGTYYFRSRSAEGCWSPMVAESAAGVTIYDIPQAVAVTGEGAQCGGARTLTAQGGEGGTIYYQGAQSGGTSTASALSSATLGQSGTYYFRARSPLGCWGPEGSAEVTINAIPQAVTVTGGGNQCLGTRTLTASGGAGGTIYFQGAQAGGTSTANLASSASVEQSGTYYFRSRSPEGCWGPEGSQGVTIRTNLVDYTREWSATWSQLYYGQGNLGQYASSNIWQGRYDNNIGYLVSQVGFNDANIRTVLGDYRFYDVTGVQVYLFFDYWNNGNGQARVGRHNNTSKPATFSNYANPEVVANYGGTGGGWINAPVAWGTYMREGSMRGITLGPVPDANTAYLGRARAFGQVNPPGLRVTYRLCE